jgi:hypothetical protein
LPEAPRSDNEFEKKFGAGLTHSEAVTKILHAKDATHFPIRICGESWCEIPERHHLATLRRLSKYETIGLLSEN